MVIGLSVGLFAGTALAGTSWDEVADGGGDAGALIPGAQSVGSAGDSITQITGSTGDSDFIDLYLINITDPANFVASTAGDQGGFGGMADFDTKLWLFDIDGFGVLSNDDFGGAPFHSELLPNADDGSGASIVGQPGLYYLAVGGFGDDALDSNGDAIFDNAAFDEISGPDGPGGNNPLADWEADGSQGNYTLALQGVSGVPAPGALALLGLVGVLGGRRRRK